MISKDNSYVLGIGTRVCWGDYINIGEDFIPVRNEHAGHIITGDEGFDVRRLLAPRPLDEWAPITIEDIAKEYQIQTHEGRRMLRIGIDTAILIDSLARQ